MNISDLVKVRHVSSIALSPDGTTLAYGLTRMRNVLNGEPNGAALRHLYISRGPGQERAYLTDDVTVGGVQFTPDGRKIAFRAAMSGDTYTSLYTIAVDGGGAMPLIKHVSSIGSYSFSPDGDRVYFVASPAPDEDAAAMAEKGFNARIYEDDKKPNTLWSFDLSKKGAKPKQIKIDGHPSSVKASPDGKHIAVAIAPTPHVDDQLMKRRVFFLNATTGRTVHVVETNGKIGSMAIAPDGKSFAIIAGVDKNDPAATTLYEGRIGSKSLQELRSGPFAVVDVKWLENNKIALLIHEGEGSRIEFLENGKIVRTLNEGHHVAHALAAGGTRLAASVSGPDHPRRAYIVAEDGMKAWTKHNDWLADIAFAKAESYRFKARDGQTVSGVLTYPLKRRGKRRVPLLLMVHGGPEAHDSNAWNTNYGDPVQIAAGKGYAVFQPNYRGSTGRGTAYSKQHQNDYAGKEFNDLVDAVKALVADGLVDEDRVGITGGSYGGYASAWAATNLTEHFAASVMFVGISNQISKFGTTDIPNEMYLVHSRKWPWEDWQKMIEVSPIAYAGQSKTPTLILHGEEDTRVHPSQSYEMYRNLKLRSQAPVRFVTYPGEGHGNRLAASRIDYAVRLMRWMDHFVMDKKKGVPAMGLEGVKALMPKNEGGDK